MAQNIRGVALTILIVNMRFTYFVQTKNGDISRRRASQALKPCPMDPQGDSAPFGDAFLKSLYYLRFKVVFQTSKAAGRHRQGSSGIVQAGAAIAHQSWQKLDFWTSEKNVCQMPAQKKHADFWFLFILEYGRALVQSFDVLTSWRARQTPVITIRLRWSKARVGNLAIYLWKKT